MSNLKVDKWLNPDGTENYKCRAWVNFTTVTATAINASGNVSSLTDNGTGDTTINFTDALPDGNYTISGGTTSTVAATQPAQLCIHAAGAGSVPTLKTATQLRVATPTNIDVYDVSVNIFR